VFPGLYGGYYFISRDSRETWENLQVWNLRNEAPPKEAVSLRKSVRRLAENSVVGERQKKAGFKVDPLC